jgi:hypothetical protein
MEKGDMKWRGAPSELVPAGILDRYMGVDVLAHPASREG